MIVQHVRVIVNRNNYSNHSSHNKGDTINVTKAAVRKFILMQITRVGVANGYH